MDNINAYINAISPISNLTWLKISQLLTPEKILKNQYFAKQNQVAKKIGFLESGVVRAFFSNAAGQEYNKQFFVGPSIIGAYSSLLTSKPNLIAQQALTDCMVYSCTYSDLVQLFDEHQDLERLVRKIAEYYFIEKEKKELDIVLLNATQRYLVFKVEFPSLEQLIPQYHIASYLGISAIQLSRIRKELAVKKKPI
ncbi:Crp/Fnr family transcriptional regulator [Flavihumibacter sp. RY-1]|uniref:Crp/Fnr family transcriptional regulator n=1 Tax=Flavihumibacter fluminis TaxID=2909236 RepID=A0ABS9BDC8_9BACT|nr:Crp/Fnr family transcriptional regulator [Flavihumibacter fluminis]MCF1713290.1 Crp/Fnr family transcriptional regulator [Flavihumibacter fluminis]